MNEVIYGRIIKAYSKERIISVRVKNKVEYFYLEKSISKKFKKFLAKGIILTIDVNKISVIKFGKKVRIINHFKKIVINKRKTQKVFYDIKVIKNGIKELLNNLGNMMFIDFEFNMQENNRQKNFTPEIVQAGVIVVNNKFKHLSEMDTYVEPIFNDYTKRLLKFLHINREDVEDAIKYDEFYREFNNMLEKYKPTILTWGRNDMLSLTKSYKYHKKNNITKNVKIINLMQIYKNYYNLKNDLGLFKAFDLYNIKVEKQKHNAYEDALFTKKLFIELKKLCNK